MTKRDIIMQIRSAKASHIRWKSFVQISLRGILSEESNALIPLIKTESEFGKWYYGDGMFLSNVQSYKDLEEPHDKVHEAYIQIYTLLKSKLKEGLFSNKNAQIKKRQEQIDKLMEDFNDYSKILIETLQQLEIDILQMPDDEIANLVAYS